MPLVMCFLVLTCIAVACVELVMMVIMTCELRNDRSSDMLKVRQVFDMLKIKLEYREKLI